jgi:hypothetical protein
MTTDEPTQYAKVCDDIGIVESDAIPDYVLHVAEEGTVDPLGHEAVDAGSWEVRAARVTPAERAQWLKDYATMKQETDAATAHLEAARKVWEAAQKTTAAKVIAAWEDYQHVHELIKRRMKDVEALRDAEDERQYAEERKAAAEAKAAEDAELGPQTWAAFFPRSGKVKTAADMYVPVLHLAGCSVLGGREYVSYSNSCQLLRATEVRRTLLEGGPETSRERRTGRTLPTKLCGRCKPQQSLHEELGEVYDTWQAETDAIQPPLPSQSKYIDQQFRKILPKYLPLYHHKVDGYSQVSDSKYREKELIKPYEVLIGWYGHLRKSIVPNPERLEALFETLPDHGWAVRHVKSPWPGEENQLIAVAVRKMTVAEIRQHAADKATGEQVMEIPPAVPLED